MSKYIVVVESPAKSKTIKKYLGKDFEILASYGHVRDLPNKNGSVETDNHFHMHYETIDRNKKHVDAIAKAMKKAEALYLATDPDREGEAISWHVREMLDQKKLLKDKPVHRIVFHEITKQAVQDAVAHPRELSMELIDAQRARRALDYLVGFTLSPLLWKKIRRGLSAGRVQSPALRLIVERELEIEKFVSQEYWTIEADLSHNNQPFGAKLIEWQGDKLEQFSITNAQQAADIQAWLNQQAPDQTLLVDKVDKKQRKRHPAAPFITSTLQQEASRKLGFTTRRTMQVAQQLYEGIDLGKAGTIGLITYMRTDSVSLANEAVFSIRDYITQHYGQDALPEPPRMFKTKSKNAQEAHEAIRPTDINHRPDSIRMHLSDEQYKLYNLIWKRTLACQMIHATIHTVAVDFLCGEGAKFRATGSTIAKPGFMRVYQESQDDSKKKEEEKLLPPLEVGDSVKLIEIKGLQHFTEPPPRYSEASLVKALEEYGIGRPSTYASIISTLQQREYTLLEKKRFHPTDVGRIVNRFLTEYFTQYVDYDFTAKLEDELDAISRGEKAWVPVLEDFWHPFTKKISDIDSSVKKSDVTHEPLDEKCPECGNQLSIRLGKTGRFIGCDNYPECKYTRNVNEDKEQAQPEVITDRKCPKCQSELHIKTGRYGKFIGCSAYPECKHMEPLHKPKNTGVTCPECQKGELLERKSRRGKVFYSCDRYPKCKYALWNQPIAEPCPVCDWPILTVKTTKRAGTQKVCPQPECKFVEDIES